MHTCSVCKKQNKNKWGSGRFCSRSCANSFSTKAKRDLINAKVSKKLKGRSVSETTRQKLKSSWQNQSTRDNRKRRPTYIEECLITNSPFSGNYIKRRLFNENIKPYICEVCRISSYNNKPITLQLHHKNGINNDHQLDNLQVLCPNCHSQTHNYGGRNRIKSSSRNSIG